MMGLDRKNSVQPRHIIASFMYTTVKDQKRDIKGLSNILVDLKNKNPRFKELASDISIARVPDSWYSYDIEGMVNLLVTMGYAKERSPIRLTKEGEEYCLKIIREGFKKNKEQMKVLLSSLNLEIKAKEQVGD